MFSEVLPIVNPIVNGICWRYPKLRAINSFVVEKGSLNRHIRKTLGKVLSWPKVKKWDTLTTTYKRLQLGSCTILKFYDWLKVTAM